MRREHRSEAYSCTMNEKRSDKCKIRRISMFLAMKTQFCIFIPVQEVRRVDMYLSTLFPDHSRSYMQKLIEKGRLTVNGKVLENNKRVKK